MKDPSILEATGSEPLSLEEEYEMQQSWRDDEKKCTFIVLDRDNVDDSSIQDDQEMSVDDFVASSLSAMAGDVNLFLSDIEDEEETDDKGDIADVDKTQESSDYPRVQAEIDIMVANTASKRKGIGKKACLLMMQYAATNLRIQRFFCKINDTNEASLSLFRKIGFLQCDYAECFRQVEMELKAPSSEAMCRRVKELLDL